MSDIVIYASLIILVFGLTGAISYIVYLRRKHHAERVDLRQALTSTRLEVDRITSDNLPVRSKLDYYTSILDDQPNMIVRWKIDGTLTYVNQNYCDDMRRTEEDLIGSNFLEWTDEANRQAIIAKLQNLSPDDPVQASVHSVINDEGQKIWHQWVDRAIFDDNGDVIEVQSVGTDITSQKMLEQKSVQLQIAQEREQFLQEFLNTITHDLKTPLSVIRSSIYLARRTKDTGKHEHHLDKIESQIIRQEKMINGILDVMRLNHAPKDDWRPVSLNMIVTTVIAMLQAKAKAKQQELMIYLDTQLPNIFGNSEQIERVVMNLIENAINYTPSNGNVIISTKSDDAGYVQLTIKDTGIGIPAKEHDRIFDQFYRASNAQAIKGGTGLGLSIVKTIVERHDGHITIDSSTDAGTTFAISLPAHRS